MGRAINWERIRREKQMREQGTEPISLDLLPEPNDDVVPPKRPKVGAQGAIRWEPPNPARTMRIVTPEEKARVNNRLRGKQKMAAKPSQKAASAKAAKRKTVPLSGELYSGKTDRMKGVVVERRPSSRKPKQP
ncbi:MAG: hypothetical protein K1X67_12335 [Fimbriimonadaceae bacterium]|nr:hypothetical protein [Fimbriimonadaceae bacterium]